MNHSESHATTLSTTFEVAGTGSNVYETDELIEGVAKWLETPEDVMDFVSEGDVSDVIVIARGGTTTFLTMALNAGIKGIVTLQGAPESHLGIISREYGIPAIMSVDFEEGVHTSRGETIPADGVRIRLDVSSRPSGTVSVEAGAPREDKPNIEPEHAPLSEEQQAQIALLLENFGGEVPHGVEGDKIMQAEMKTRVLFADDDVKRELTRQEVNEAIRYYTWNEWDALSARATEGESGLIPRQEYEAMGIANCWFKHPNWLRAIEDRVGMDGIIDIGATGHREIGSKVNMLHLWALATATSFGRGISLELGLHGTDFRADRVRTTFSTARRLYKGLWSEGAILSSMKGYKAEVLDKKWIDRFAENRIDLADPSAREDFVRFNGSAELMGFLLHFDNRTGVSDHGPYPLDDGGFVLVRDIFLNEPAWPWNNPESPLPWSVTVAMFFEADAPLETKVVDISTLFTTPANYIPHISGVSVYQRDAWNTPMDEVRPLAPEDMARLRLDCEEQSSALYRRIAAMSTREKVEAGALTYSAGFALPVARAAGMYDELVADYGFTKVDPALEESYDTVVSGVATELIPRLFLTGSWGNPVPETASDQLSDNDRMRYQVYHAIAVRGFATIAKISDSTGLPADTVAEVLNEAIDARHIKQNVKRGLNSLTGIGKGAHKLLSEAAIEDDAKSLIATHYKRFLEPNRLFKELTTDWQQGRTEDMGSQFDSVHNDITVILDGLTAVDSRFTYYTTHFNSAAASFRSGDTDALAKPLTDSYHDIWMELHEDFLATLSLSRSEADG